MLYLLAVVALSIVRLASLIRQLWLLRQDSPGKAERALDTTDLNQAELERNFFTRWDSCSVRIQSMKRSVVLTFLLSLLAAADQTRALLVSTAVEKITAFAAIAGGLAEALEMLVLGILVCAVIYAAADFC